MSKNELREVRHLLDFAPVDRKYEELKELYLGDFHTLSGIENFVMNCGGVDAALEVLHVCEARK